MKYSEFQRWLRRQGVSFESGKGSHQHAQGRLARLLGVHMPQVDRLLDLRHRSKLEQADAALNAVGYRIEPAVQAA